MTSTDPDYGIHNSRFSPEQRLFVAILQRTLIDLFGMVALTSRAEEVNVAKHDALRLLTAESGPWAKRRDEICAVIGFDGITLRHRIIATLEGDDTAVEIYGDRDAFKQLKEARQLWANEKARQAEAQAARIAQGVAVIHRRAQRKAHEQQLALVALEAEERETMLAEQRLLDPVSRVVQALSKRPLTIREVLFETGGDFSTSIIRQYLFAASEQGLVERDGPHWQRVSPTTLAA